MDDDAIKILLENIGNRLGVPKEHSMWAVPVIFIGSACIITGIAIYIAHFTQANKKPKIHAEPKLEAPKIQEEPPKQGEKPVPPPITEPAKPEEPLVKNEVPLVPNKATEEPIKVKNEEKPIVLENQDKQPDPNIVSQNITNNVPHLSIPIQGTKKNKLIKELKDLVLDKELTEQFQKRAIEDNEHVKGKLVYTDKKGNKWLYKPYENKDYRDKEIIAGKILTDILGPEVAPPCKLLKDDQGNILLGTMSKILLGSTQLRKVIDNTISTDYKRYCETIYPTIYKKYNNFVDVLIKLLFVSETDMTPGNLLVTKESNIATIDHSKALLGMIDLQTLCLNSGLRKEVLMTKEFLKALCKTSASFLKQEELYYKVENSIKIAIDALNLEKSKVRGFRSIINLDAILMQELYWFIKAQKAVLKEKPVDLKMALKNLPAKFFSEDISSQSSVPAFPIIAQQNNRNGGLNNAEGDKIKFSDFIRTRGTTDGDKITKEILEERKNNPDETAKKLLEVYKAIKKTKLEEFKSKGLFNKRLKLEKKVSSLTKTPTPRDHH